ncbi:hypothetical protein CLV28_1102 [Sediminihabitans luteus]|uniref:Uncharacterized protein n=1 Tax=Sediminihabitans luteus TaxID=1138585 RepID=A0A2M9D0Z7_9CELL|nr:hypothetical protein [Sediminihabitans luteus]PJJ77876.1 hypothetical protein CLV28_1102 [Sediminihabitans luteus]GII99766.1 hypothetical protein Slu03_21440 [Sediminihabitans luteus]
MTLTTTPSHEQVRRALMWALAHDRETLLWHRHQRATAPTSALRARADAAIVQRWLERDCVPA